MTGGSLPLELSIGASSRTDEVDAVEQQVTLDISIEEYNETVIRLALAALYGVPIERISLAVAAGSVQLTVTIRSDLPLNGSATEGSSASQLSSTGIATAIGMVDSAALGTSLGAALGMSVSVLSSSVRQTTISQVTEFVVGPGKWTTAGRVIPCPKVPPCSHPVPKGATLQL